MNFVIHLLRAHGTVDATGLSILAVVFVLTGLVPIPRTALCIAAGAIFGMWAVPVIMPSTTLGGLIGFLASRYLISERLYRMATNRPRWRAVMKAIDEENWRLVGLMRFASVMPTFSQNYLFGITRIGVVPYLLATFFFSIPQVCLYVYLGSLGRAALLNEPGSPVGLLIAATGGVCLLVVLALVVRKTRAALRAEVGVEGAG